MLTKKRYSVKDMLLWTRRETMNEDQETIPKQFPEEYNVQM